MIEAVFRRGERGIAGFALRGHAEVAPKGQDIVCAAVSALAQAALIGLEEVVGVAAEVEVAEGWLRCQLPEGLPPQRQREAQVLLETLLLSLRSIEEGYGDALRVRVVPARRGFGRDGAAPGPRGGGRAGGGR